MKYIKIFNGEDLIELTSKDYEISYLIGVLRNTDEEDIYETNINIKIWSKDEIMQLLFKNNDMVIKSLLELYKLQTSDERESECTDEKNGVGFNKFDGGILSNMAEYYLKYGKLSRGQLDLVRKKIIKPNIVCGENVFFLKQNFPIYNKK